MCNCVRGIGTYNRYVCWHVQVGNCSVTLPGKASVDVATYSAAGSTTTAGSSSGPTTAAISVVSIKSTDLEVAVAAPANANSSAAPAAAPINLAKIVDTTPPVITLEGGGDVYMTVLQADSFVDPGVRVYDNIDGNSLTAVTRLQLCTRPAVNLSTLLANDSRALTGCGPQLAGVNTTAPSRNNETYVLMYTARDTAGNQAVPLRRYVGVTSR